MTDSVSAGHWSSPTGGSPDEEMVKNVELGQLDLFLTKPGCVFVKKMQTYSVIFLKYNINHSIASSVILPPRTGPREQVGAVINVKWGSLGG